MTTETNDKPVTQTELKLAIAEFRTEMIERMDQIKLELIERIDQLEIRMIKQLHSALLIQTIVLLGAILAAAHYLR